MDAHWIQEMEKYLLLSSQVPGRCQSIDSSSWGISFSRLWGFECSKLIQFGSRCYSLVFVIGSRSCGGIEVSTCLAVPSLGERNEGLDHHQDREEREKALLLMMEILGQYQVLWNSWERWQRNYLIGSLLAVVWASQALDRGVPGRRGSLAISYWWWKCSFLAPGTRT